MMYPIDYDMYAIITLFSYKCVVLGMKAYRYYFSGSSYTYEYNFTKCY